MGFIKKLFGGNTANPGSKTSAEKTLDIIGAYGDLLESRTPGSGMVCDISELPYSKVEIKHALTTMLRVTKDPYMKGQLKNSYLLLSDWQEGVGKMNIGVDEDPVLKIAELTVKWAPLVQAENAQLKSELMSMGLW